MDCSRPLGAGSPLAAVRIHPLRSLEEVLQGVVGGSAGGDEGVVAISEAWADWASGDHGCRVSGGTRLRLASRQRNPHRRPADAAVGPVVANARSPPDRPRRNRHLLGLTLGRVQARRRRAYPSLPPPATHNLTRPARLAGKDAPSRAGHLCFLRTKLYPRTSRPALATTQIAKAAEVKERKINFHRASL